MTIYATNSNTHKMHKKRIKNYKTTQMIHAL